MAVDGGRSAARGYQYQYLQTLERVLPFIENDDSHGYVLRVEGPSETEAGRADVVDFDVVDQSGDRLLVAQVKSRQPGAMMRSPEIIEILCRLVGIGPSARYEIITNAELSDDAKELSKLLHAGLTDERLLAALERLLLRAPRRLSQVRGLTNAERQRLGRCHLIVDHRDPVEVRESLRESLRSYRFRVGYASGFYSSGLLTGFLVAEILDRAAASVTSSVTIGDLARLVLVPDTDLRAALGRVDWALIAGPMKAIPDVPRLGLLDELTDHFRPRPSSERSVRLSLIKGLSGMGKSSLAAQYVAHRADSYDCVIWINAESQSSIRSSIAVAARVLPLGPSVDPASDELSMQFASALSSAPWPWLLIADNVSSLNDMASLIPAIGRGDVIVTTIDSTAYWPGAQDLPMPVMTRDEARDLFVRRTDSSSQGQDTVDLLIDELTQWPLAIELAAAYIRASGASVAGIGQYLEKLKARCIGDSSLAPPDYPRAVTEVVGMAVDLLNSRIEQRSMTDPAYMARACLNVLCYLAGRQVPIHILLAAVVIPPHRLADHPDLGLATVDEGEFYANEVVRELRRVSLATTDVDLPPTSHEDHQGLDRTLAVNALVQEVIRAQVDVSPVADNCLASLAEHLKRWITAAYGFEDWPRLFVLMPHASTLAAHIVRLDCVRKSAANFLGNVAAIYLSRGLHREARRLLELELSVLGPENDPDMALEAQTRLALAQILVIYGSREDTDGALAHFERVYFIARQYVGDVPETAQFLATNALLALRQPAFVAALGDRADTLIVALEDMSSRLPTTESATALMQLHEANVAMGKGDFKEAERICRILLRTDPIGNMHTTETSRLLAEALAKQERWVDAMAQVDDVLDRCRSGMYPDALVSMTNNLGVYLAGMSALHSDSQETVTLLDRIVRCDIVSEAMSGAGEAMRNRFLLLQLFLDGVSGDTALPDPAALRIAGDGSNASWAVLWSLIARR